MKSQLNSTRKKKQVSIQMWIGLVISFVGIMSCIGFVFYLLITSSTYNLNPSPQISINTELPPTNLVTVTSIVTPLPPPTLAPTWTPIPTFTPFIITTVLSTSGCYWMEHIVGEWDSDLLRQIITFYPNGEYVEIDKKLIDYRDTLSVRGTYECTSEGYLRLLIQGEEVFETSIIRVIIAGKSMKWILVDDDNSNGHGSDITFSFDKIE